MKTPIATLAVRAAASLSAALLACGGADSRLAPPAPGGILAPERDPAVATTPAPAATPAPASAPGAVSNASPRGGTQGASEVRAEEEARLRVNLRCQPPDRRAGSTDYSEAGPYRVAVMELMLQDDTRPIPETKRHPAAPARRLPTRIYYPASDPAPLFEPPPIASDGPFPLLMYSHGFSSSREESNTFGRRAASHGFIVAAPDFPLTHGNANGGAPDIEDVAAQPGDVSFLIDRLLALSAAGPSPLAGGVDPARIGALGVSLGGLTTLLLGYHAQLMDPRIAAIAPIAAPSFFLTERFYDTRDLPLLLVHGDLDAFVHYEANARSALARAAPSARLLTIAAGSHTGFAAPIDGALLGLIQPLFAPPEAHAQNPDGLGCGFVGARIAKAPPTFASIGGPEVGIEAAEEQTQAALPCSGPEYTVPALDLNVQMALLATSVVAFFEAHLGPDEAARGEGCGYLLESLVQDPAVTLE